MNNLILLTDSYKTSHFLQYPENTEYVYSYIESRGNNKGHKSIKFFGLQMMLKRYFLTPITKDDIDEAEAFFKAHGTPFNRGGWEHILTKHGGLMPLEINAVKEGSVMPLKNAMLTVVNTDPAVPWLTSHFEPLFLQACWYGSTVATISYQIKQELINAFLETSDEINWSLGSFDAGAPGLPFKLHDFGFRGVSSVESAMMGDAAHLANFMGTDTVIGAWAAQKYYGGGMPGFSIPAAEHSTVTSWGKEGEKEAYENMINQFAGEGRLYAVVSDSYDLENAVNNIWGGELKEKVLEKGGTLIVRPDSGDPASIVVKTLSGLWGRFGGTKNGKGFKVLHPSVRVIQGDGINLESIKEILKAMTLNEFSVDNIAFGMGGALLQQCDRDTYKFAMKCSAICVNGEWRDVYKEPKTDPGKTSKKGRLAPVWRSGGDIITVREDAAQDESLLREVFKDGELLIDLSFDEVRKGDHYQVITLNARSMLRV